MTVLAGIDIGNATTEVVLAQVRIGRVEHLAVGRIPTRRAKGSPESLRAAAGLVRRLERGADVRVQRAFAAPLRPVRTVSGSLPEARPRTGRLWVAAAGAPTVGGGGFGVGRPVLLGEAADGEGPVVVVAPRGAGYDEIAAGLAPLADAGRLAAVLVEDDEGVLVANRLHVRVPVVDDLDATALLTAERLAVEVTAGGQPMQTLNDALKLATAFALPESELPDAARLAATLFDTSNAVVALGARPEHPPDQDGTIELAGVGRIPFLAGTERVRNGRIGAATGFSLHPGQALTPVDDLWTVDLGAIATSLLARRAAVRSRPVALAAMHAATPATDKAAELAELLGVPVDTPGTEAEAARVGALTTPGAGRGAVVIDLGGGTIDAVSPTAAAVAAGAGDLLTLAVATLTGVTGAAAEWVKRGPAHRVEAPQLLLTEEGSRAFLDQPAPPDSVGALVVTGPAGMLPFSRAMAPAEWRALRLRLKVELIGGNVARALRTLGEDPGTVVVVGGLAGDEEILAAVADALPSGTAVGRGAVGGTLGHRYSVAYGLVALGAVG